MARGHECICTFSRSGYHTLRIMLLPCRKSPVRAGLGGIPLAFAVRDFFDDSYSPALALSNLFFNTFALNYIVFLTNLLRQFAVCQSCDGASQLLVTSLVLGPQGEELFERHT
jgi:hypothetical protein